MTATAEPTTAREGKPRKGGVVTWACAPGFPPAVIFPFTPAERMGTRNIIEFQMLMYRPLFYFGSDGTPNVDWTNSIGEPPVWSEDGLSCTIKVKPWQWSNGETMCADNVLFWVNLMRVKGDKYGEYVPGYFPDFCTEYGKLTDDTLYFKFDKKYNQHWMLYNQFSTITPLPKAWDRTADGPANASADLGDLDVDEVAAVYDYLMQEQGDHTDEGNAHRTRWAGSPVWSIVSGPWRLKEYTEEGLVTFVPNEHYSGPSKPYLDEFRQVPTFADEEQFAKLQEGPDAPGAFQVGYLPLSMATDRVENPTDPGDNPIGHNYTLVPQTAYCIRYFCLNYNNPTWKGKLFAQTYLRQALATCLDQDSAVSDIYQGRAYRQNGPVPMYPPSEHTAPSLRTGSGPLPFDPARAKRLLAENGWDTSVFPAVCADADKAGAPEGAELTLLMRYVEGRPALTRLMRKFKVDCAAAGIDLVLEEVYGSVLVWEDAPCVPTDDNPCLWELTCWNGGWAYHHPTGEILFSTNAGGNFGHYSDPRADALIEKTVTSDDPAVFHEYQEFIAREVPVIFTPNFPIRLFEVANSLGGFGPVNPYGMINPENWYYVD
jgi:peptide/nickel transport system substrate-binding protein